METAAILRLYLPDTSAEGLQNKFYSHHIRCINFLADKVVRSNIRHPVFWGLWVFLFGGLQAESGRPNYRLLSQPAGKVT